MRCWMVCCAEGAAVCARYRVRQEVVINSKCSLFLAFFAVLPDPAHQVFDAILQQPKQRSVPSYSQQSIPANSHPCVPSARQDAARSRFVSERSFQCVHCPAAASDPPAAVLQVASISFSAGKNVQQPAASCRQCKVGESSSAFGTRCQTGPLTPDPLLLQAPMDVLWPRYAIRRQQAGCSSPWPHGVGCCQPVPKLPNHH